MPHVTLKEIAKHARVSVATVSLALRGQGRLQSETVRRVHQVAAELGYVPNPLLAALATRRFRGGVELRGTPVALLECAVTGRGEDRPPAIYREGLEKTCRALGYSLQRFTLQELEGGLRPWLRSLFNRGTQGCWSRGNCRSAAWGSTNGTGSPWCSAAGREAPRRFTWCAPTSPPA